MLFECASLLSGKICISRLGRGYPDDHTTLRDVSSVKFFPHPSIKEVVQVHLLT